jgi:hypothetical protein
MSRLLPATACRRRARRPRSGEIIAQLYNSVRIETINPFDAITPFGDQPRLLQYFQMLRHRRARHRQAGGKLPHRHRPGAQSFKNGSAGWCGKRIEFLLVSHRLLIFEITPLVNPNELAMDSGEIASFFSSNSRSKSIRSAVREVN